MPALCHLAVGLAAARARRKPPRLPTFAWAAVLILLSYLPDFDVIAFKLGIPYQEEWGHRGAAHSLGFALICGLILAAAGWATRLYPAWIGLIGGVVMATHGILDAFTDGGLGIALLWPISDVRYFAPWTPIPVAPIGLGMLSQRGLDVVLTELLIFSPLFLVAAWPRRSK